ncbi:thioredoxin-dependent thiol peroxidase [Ornithinimicrobium avium]|uniref:thioredoxin-dependent peroxiredoxin n=1 Tax=Ornithinimicrobium avium TaxID=2283195 RepID=A0A345NLX8_9MICO|nr:thioredoxin-dependent thiol peroxidase [Ornithinimicrobium avium]AXH96036.1 thioredoxin-dependent thiol peroxidase [Ornithinimicrobium avium]
MSRLEPGQPAPAWTLPTADGKELSLSDLAGQKVILYVYPAAMTPGCTTQACDFRDNLAVLQRAGYAVVGISPDSPEKLAKFIEKEGLTFPLVSDESKEVLTAYGAFGEKKLYGKTVTGVIRSTFVLDERGVVELARYNVRAKGHVASLAKQLGVGLPAA